MGQSGLGSNGAHAWAMAAALGYVRRVVEVPALRIEGLMRRFSHILITNTLCCAISAAAAVNAAYIIHHWPTIVGLWRDLMRWTH